MKIQKLIAAAAIGSSLVLASTAMAADTGKPKQSVGEYAGDAVVTTKVKAAIVAEKALSALDIAVVTNNGTVTLSGKVASAAQSDLATKTARGVEGVKQVKNMIKVDPVHGK
jgi:hyperosmotically inducible protein